MLPPCSLCQKKHLKLLLGINITNCLGTVNSEKKSPVGPPVDDALLCAVLFFFPKYCLSKKVPLVVIMHQRVSTLILMHYLYLNMQEAYILAENHYFSHCITTVESAVPSIKAIHQGAGRIHVRIGGLYMASTSAAGGWCTFACLHFHTGIDLISKVKC